MLDIKEKTKMKRTFKLIPFLISLLLVVGVTFLICWYSFYGYKLNRIRFYENYFHQDDYKDVETTTLIENAVKFEFIGYKKASDTVAFHNVSESGVKFTYKNGTLNVPGYFDVDIYLVDTTSDVDGDASYSYYFYFYNVNYSKIANTDLPLVVLTAKGVGSPSEDELNDPDVKLFSKIPDKFKISTPIGPYNPDWAVYVQNENEKKMYFVIETKGSKNMGQLRGDEWDKIQCGKKHFEALNSGIEFDFDTRWNDFKKDHC